MSQKNHKMTDGKLLQTDKKYAQLKLKQKEKIAEWMFQVTRDYYTKNYTFPNDRQIEKVVNIVYEKIEEAEIWVPYGEVLRHYKSKRSAINRRVRKELNEKEENRNEKVCFMNMCMVQDDKGNVLALDKVNDSYTGTTFPGGHVEQNEIFQKSIIREVWEEKPDFNELVDPKCDWALRHLEQFPVEIETASYARLLRVPGIGPKSASRITHARRYGRLDFASLKKMGVVLKRAHYFITCGGKQMYHTPVEASYIMRQLVSVDKKDVWNIEHSNESYVQLSLADFGIG